MPALTVEIIFSLDADYLGNPRFFQAGAPGDAVAFNFGILGGSEVLAGDVNGFNPDYSGATQVSLGEIHHAAMVYDGATLEFYLDGNLDATHILAAGALWDIPSLYVFSEAGGGQFFDGCMYEARISDTALDPSGFLPIGLRVATARATVVSRPGSIVGFTGWARDLGNAPLSFDGAKIRITGPLNDSNVLYDGSAIWLGPSEALSHTFVLPVDASAIAGIYTYELALTSGGTDIASDTFEVDVRTP